MTIGANAERRQVTVLFCDLVDSSGLAEALDPEDYRKVLLPFHNACKAAVERFGGRVSQYLGDGVLAVFGHPHAHEDDAVHATRAALTILTGVETIALPAQVSTQHLAVRIGIATGLVVVGDGAAAASDGHEPFSGQTPILAQRLQVLAAHNGVLISENTYRIVGERFECTALGSHRLKGFSEPERVWSVTAERRSALRFVGRQAVPPLVGRQAELDRLTQLWRDAQQGRGRAVYILGDAGIGKSRLVRGLLDRSGLTPRDTLLFQCDSLYANTAFHPVIERIRRAAGISSEDPDPVKFDKLRAWYGDEAPSADALPLLAALLSIEGDERFPLPEESAQRHKARLFQILIRYLVRAASRRPLVIVLEDTHWVDPSTDEFVRFLCRRIHDLRALLVCTSRPDYDSQWLTQAGVERMELAPLQRNDAAELANRTSGGKLDAYALQQVIGMADGVPLFVEELSKFVAEKSRNQGQPSIPARLRDPLTERLDQVGEARLVAQVASVIGRQFSYVLMTSVYQGPEKALGEGLRRLQQADLIQAAETPDAWGDGAVDTTAHAGSQAIASTYVFKHALLQEAAYETLLRDFRPELHRRTAEALEALFPQTVRDEPEVLAHHWTEAGQAEKGAAAWLRAGQLAAERCQYREAIAQLRRGLALVASIANPHVRRAQELALLVALGPVLSTAEGGGTAEVNELYARAMELCNETPLSALHFVAHWGWWRTTMDHHTGRTRADKLLALATRLAKPELLLQAHHCQWATLYMVGRHQECCAHIEAGLAIYDGTRDSAHAASYGGHDARVCALGESALANWMLGRYAAAREHARAALQWSAAINHVGSRLHAMDYAMVLRMFERDVDAVRSQAQAMFDFATEQRLPVPRAKALFFLGWVRALESHRDQGIAEMTDGIAAVRAADTAHDFTLYYEMLAEACELAGRTDEGLNAVREGFSIAEAKGIVYWNAELHRRQGRLLLACGERDAARQAFQRALDCAQTQEARTLALRAAIALCRLSMDARSDGEQSILRPIYESLRAEPATSEIEEARMLLGSAA